MNFSPHSSSRIFNPAAQQPFLQVIPSHINAVQDNLIKAIKNQDENSFDAILDFALIEGACLDTPNEDGLIPLEIAAIENKPRIVQSLLLRGSTLPLVHPNGFDLAMLTASRGQTATLMVLLDVGNILPDAQDDCGATPLHYAVINNQLQSAVALLDRGAESNLLMTGDIDAEIRLDLRIPDSVGMTGTTALMLAVAMGNRPMTELLLSRGASCLSGARHPLELAILNDDLPMLDLLFEKKIDPNTIRLLGGKSLLTFSIENRCSLALIKKLIPPALQTQAGRKDLDAPLRTAVQTGQHDVVAYLLSQGAKIESDTNSSMSLWTLAESLNDQGKMANILVASRADHAVRMLKKDGMSLSFFCQLASQPSVISSHGLFPEVISPALPALQAIQSRSHELSPAQINFELAYCLHRLQTPEENTATTNSSSVAFLLNENNEKALENEISRKISTQIKELKELGREILAKKVNYLSQVISRPFFSLMLEKSSDRLDLAAVIQHQLTFEDGFPLPVAELIATAWMTSYEQAKRESFFSEKNHMSLQRVENQTILVLENLILKKMKENQAVRDGRSFCLTALLNVVTKRHTPIQQFITDPVAFLRLLPQSPSEKKLTEQQVVDLLSSTLGLPISMCRKIHEAWDSASTEVNIAVPTVRAGLVYDFLSQSMAAALKLMLYGPRNHPQDSENIMPLRLQARLLQWCNSILAQQDEDDDRDQEPPSKRARFS